MGLRITTILKLNDKQTCERIMDLLDNCFSKKYIRQQYQVTERELERIIEYYSRKADRI